MGCDIHTYIEFKDFTDRSGNPVYTCFAEIDLDRNYELFSLLAGVRGWYEPVVEPRGLPENLSFLAASKEPESSNFHSRSWLTLKELKRVQERYKKNGDEGEEHFLLGVVIATMKKLNDEGHKSRLVFWFDS